MDKIKFGEMLNDVWNSKKRAIDWLSLEAILDMVLNSKELTEPEKIAFTKETIDAHTRRGHFPTSEYPEAR